MLFKHIQVCAKSAARINVLFLLLSFELFVCIIMIAFAVFSTKLSAEELADWLHSHHNLPEGACKVLKGEGRCLYQP